MTGDEQAKAIDQAADQLLLGILAQKLQILKLAADTEMAAQLKVRAIGLEHMGLTTIAEQVRARSETIINGNGLLALPAPKKRGRPKKQPERGEAQP